MQRGIIAHALLPRRRQAPPRRVLRFRQPDGAIENPESVAVAPAGSRASEEGSPGPQEAADDAPAEALHPESREASLDDDDDGG